MDKKNEVIWVLHVCNKLSVGGVQAFLMNYYRNIDRNKIQFAFLVQRDFSYPYDQEILEMGGRVHKITSIKNIKNYSQSFEKIIDDHPEYKIIHSHMHNRNSIPLLIAKKKNIPIRISHAHNTGVPMSTLTKLRFNLMKIMIKFSATNYYACTPDAGIYLHGKNSENIIIKNAINLEQFLFDSEIRKQYREELGLNDEYVVGHVGNFTPQKNYNKIIKVFQKLPDNYKLLLVGDGNDLIKIKNEVDSLNLTKKVVFMGERSDVYNVMQAMDLFIFPSLFEGLGIVAIEAQTSGLTTVVSSAVPLDACVTDYCIRLDLDESDRAWAECIEENISFNRNQGVENIRKKGYSIIDASKDLSDKYISLFNNIREG